MHSTYYDKIRLSDKPIVREASQNSNTHIRYAEGGVITGKTAIPALRPA